MLRRMSSPDKDIAGTLRHPWVRALIVVAMLALLATAALGGFRKAESHKDWPVFGAGQQAESGALLITPLCAWTTAQKPGRQSPDADKRYLVLRVRAENLTERDGSRYLGQDVVWLPDGRTGEQRAASSQRADDHSYFVQLQPRLPGTVDLVWELPGAAAPRQPVTWGVYRRRFEPRTYLSGEAMWVQDGPAAKLVLQARGSCTAAGQA